MLGVNTFTKNSNRNAKVIQKSDLSFMSEVWFVADRVLLSFYNLNGKLT